MTTPQSGPAIYDGDGDGDGDEDAGYLDHICDDDVDGDGDGDDRINHHPDFLKTMMIRVTMTRQQKQQS